MEDNNQKLKVHIWASVIVFVLLSFVRFVFLKIKIPYGYGAVTLGSLFLLLYGFYLIFVSSLYFKNLFYCWKNNNPWKKQLIKSYLLLLLFCVFITFLFLDEQGIMQLFFSFSKSPIDFLYSSLESWGMLFIVGLGIAFPTSIYTGFLSIKSLITAKQENKSYSFGISLLILSLISLIASFYSFLFTLIFWIGGGLHIRM